MDYAVVRTGGKQYRVSAGDILEIDKLPEDKESIVTFEDVLLWVAGGQVKIGKPVLSDVKIRAKILEQKKGDKIRVSKFKAKARYRRTIGFRPLLTKVVIEDIAVVKTQLKEKKTTKKTSASK